MKDRIIKFVKQKDFKFVKELGSGACGRTVELYDEVIDETFVCKKYEPYIDSLKEELFGNFLREIKLLYQLNHSNIVRVFNYYIYPEIHTGYILMELIDGSDIESFLKDNPEQITNIFNQCINGFLHLEKCDVLHRDIRPMNILVSKKGELKIIDFGFGKLAKSPTDYDKSISLNWWCELPNDFASHQYDFRTEVYFVGKLFEKIIKEEDIGMFKYPLLLKKMCLVDENERIQSFSEVNKVINEEKFLEIDFNESELHTYRNFAQNLYISISKIETNASYYDDSEQIQRMLEELYRNVMLEEHVPLNSLVASCFVSGGYYYHNNTCVFLVSELKQFIEFLRSCSKDKKNIIINNLTTRLDTIKRYTDYRDEVPF